MIKFILGMISTVSAYFEFNLGQRIFKKLSTLDRRYLAWGLMKDEVKTITFLRDDILWTSNTSDQEITKSLFIFGGFQIAELKAVLSWLEHHQYLKNKTRIIDVGANIGSTCIPLAKLTSFQILAIEPVLANFNLLETNVANNDLQDQIWCIAKAVHFSQKRVEMLSPIDNPGGTFIHNPNFYEGQWQTVKVNDIPTDTLSNILDSRQIALSDIGFIWADIEGSEIEIVNDSVLWESGIPFYCEINPEALRLQNNLDLFPKAVACKFKKYILSSSLVKEGNNCTPLPITKFESFFREVVKQNQIVDALFIP